VKNQRRSQAALDFMVSYGMALIIIAVVILAVVQLGVFSPPLSPAYCNTAPSFSCSSATMRASSGVLTILLSQATGATMNVVGAACSSQANVTSAGPGPEFGNIHVGYDAITAPQYYPDAALSNGIILYSGNSTVLRVYCYGGSGIAKGSSGDTFSGTVWLNFTITSLPNSTNNIVQVATFTAKYA
jgi:hypothetical protein